MIWNEVRFQTLTDIALGNSDSALNNQLLAEALLEGYVATQVLAVRRLMDDRKKDVISFRRLVRDIKGNWRLFTRENYVCFDGLPYDYEAVQHQVLMERAGRGFFWDEKSGPKAFGTSQMAHEQFDRLTGISAQLRRRDDRLPTSIIAKIEHWLNASGADDLAKWSHAHLAHAGGPESRKRIEHLTVTTGKIKDAIRALARAIEAISAYVLYASGRSRSLVPVALFDVFENFDHPVMSSDTFHDAELRWRCLSDERDGYLDAVESELCSANARQGAP